MNTNESLILAAAARLQPLLDLIVFVGGCATGLLITDPAAAPVRLTNDADVIAEITSYQEYMEFSSHLRKLGFVEDSSEGAPVCRWKHGTLTLDVMPLDQKILGFSNRWYAPAMAHARTHTVYNETEIRVISAPYFLATKFEAFHGRGKGDVLASHDLEDIITVVDGRQELIQEVQESEPELRRYVEEQVAALLSNRIFKNALEGYLPGDRASQARVPLLRDKLQQLYKRSGSR